jgi:hypothetical protein
MCSNAVRSSKNLDLYLWAPTRERGARDLPFPGILGRSNFSKKYGDIPIKYLKYYYFYT